MRKNIATLLAIIMIFSAFMLLPSVAYANEKISAKSSLVMDYQSGEVLFAENENDRLPIASMTKIMTLTIIFDEIDKGNLSFDEKILISDRAMKMGGSQVFLQSGNTYSADSLIKSIVIASANDSSVAMAERIGGSVEGFCDMMNEKAKELGMKDSNFVNPTGLPQENGYSSAQDVAIMTRALLSHEDYFKYSKIWMDSIQHEGDRVTEISNTNKLLRRNIGVDGGKTGYTSQAMHCISATSKKGDMRLISVVIGANSSKERFDLCENLLNSGYQNYECVKILDKNKNVSEGVSVKRAKEDIIFGVPERDYYVLTKKRTEPKEILEISYFDNLKAPIEKNEKIGVIRVYEGSELLDEISIVAREKIEKRGFFDKVKLN